MGARSHTTFKKRQKEMARLERQRNKAAKKMQRKLQAKLAPDSKDAEAGDQAFLPEEPSGVAG